MNNENTPGTPGSDEAKAPETVSQARETTTAADEPYDRNDAAAVAVYWSKARVTLPGQHLQPWPTDDSSD
jgi:hypothetical protein